MEPSQVDLYAPVDGGWERSFGMPGGRGGGGRKGRFLPTLPPGSGVKGQGESGGPHRGSVAAGGAATAGGPAGSDVRESLVSSSPSILNLS